MARFLNRTTTTEVHTDKDRKTINPLAIEQLHNEGHDNCAYPLRGSKR